MNNDNSQPAYIRLRAPLVLLALGLAGCVPMSVRHASSIPDTPAERDRGPLPTPVAFIVHPPGAPSSLAASEKDYALEVEAWRTALSGYAEPSHIYIAGGPPAPMAEFESFRNTHPVVEITVERWHPQQHAWIEFSQFMLGLTAIEADFMSLGLLPLPLSTDMSARFTLTLPAEDHSGAAQASQPGPPAPAPQHYQFTRREWLAPLFFIPGGDEYTVYLFPPCPGSGCDPIEISHREVTNWRAEEKRRLLAYFLNDIRPQLLLYAQRNQTRAAAQLPVPSHRP